jgi:lysophospholipase L1-like esterase
MKRVRLLGLTLLAGTAAFAASPAGAQAPACMPEAVAVTTNPVPPQALGGMVRYVALTKTAPPPEVDVLLLGDSLVELWPQPGLGPKAFNFALRGARTQQSLWLMHALKSKNIQPRATLIMVGTNNLPAGDPPCAIAAGVERLVQAVREAWPQTRIVVLGILPRGADYSAFEPARAGTNRLLQQRAGALGYAFLDVSEAITCGKRPGCNNYALDFIHLAPTGYAVLEEALRGLEPPL